MRDQGILCFAAQGGESLTHPHTGSSTPRAARNAACVAGGTETLSYAVIIGVSVSFLTHFAEVYIWGSACPLPNAL